MNYGGHGLTWAEVPWAGKYNVNSPIWASAHYTQATEYGWDFLPVGSGSGMLPAGGSYVSLLPPAQCGKSSASASVATSGLTVVLQTMEHDMSACFKDTHPPFTVAAQNATFLISPPLLARLLVRQRGGGGGGGGGGAELQGGALKLQARRTQLFRSHVDDPYHFVPKAQRTNRYFELLPDILVNPTTGQFTLPLGLNEIWTVTTEPTSRGDGSPGTDLGLAPIPNVTAWPSSRCETLSGHPVDTPLIEAIEAMDQQGVWEARSSRDQSVSGSTTMQQVVPVECDEWHQGTKYKFPQTFVGPSANLSTPATVTATVLPPATAAGWVGVGIGGQGTSGSADHPPATVFAIWPNRSWACAPPPPLPPWPPFWLAFGVRMVEPPLEFQNQIVGHPVFL